MLITFLVTLFVSVISGLFSSIADVVTLPVDLLNTLSTITGYGSYFIGGDLLVIFFSMIFFWMSLKIALGLVIFIWKLLPLT